MSSRFRGKRFPWFPKCVKSGSNLTARDAHAVVYANCFRRRQERILGVSVLNERTRARSRSLRCLDGLAPRNDGLGAGESRQKKRQRRDSQQHSERVSGKYHPAVLRTRERDSRLTFDSMALWLPFPLGLQTGSLRSCSRHELRFSCSVHQRSVLRRHVEQSDRSDARFQPREKAYGMGFISRAQNLGLNGLQTARKSLFHE